MWAEQWDSSSNGKVCVLTYHKVLTSTWQAGMDELELELELGGRMQSPVSGASVLEVQQVELPMTM